MELGEKSPFFPSTLGPFSETAGRSFLHSPAWRRVRLVTGQRSLRVDPGRGRPAAQMSRTRAWIVKQRRGWDGRRGRAGSRPGRCRGRAAARRPAPQARRGAARAWPCRADAVHQRLAVLLAEPLQLGPRRAKQPVGRRTRSGQPRALGPQVDLDPGRQPCSRGCSTSSHASSRRASSSAISSAMISRNSSAASSKPSRASLAERLQPAGPAVQVSQLDRPAQQVEHQRHLGVGPGAVRPAVVGGRQAVAQAAPSGRSASRSRPRCAGAERQRPRDHRPAAGPAPRRRSAGPAPSWRTAAFMRASCWMIRMDSTSTPPGAQGHLADQLALDRVPGPEILGELGLAAVDFRRARPAAGRSPCR